MSTIKHINQFDTEYLEFSNFAYSPFEYMGIVYPTAEHAFQCQKVLNKDNRELVLMQATAAQAKLKANELKDHPNWSDVKVDIMKEILIAKFSSNEFLKTKLVGTGEALLEEGNTWGDTFWGTVDGKGQNMLGKLLMEVRKLL